MSKEEDSALSKASSRRNMLKWTGALAAVGVVGIGLGLGSDMLLRPNNTTTQTATQTSVSTATKTNVETATQTATVTQTETATATKAVTQTSTSTEMQTATQTATQTTTAITTSTVTQPPTTVTATSTATVAPPQEVLLTSAHDAGPFLAHVLNGNWVKSSPLAPNLPMAPTGFMVRNRLFSPTRIRYPMQRADFDPTGNRNPQTRGTMNFVRITWPQALSLVASEISRVKSKYGPTALYAMGGTHPWKTGLHNGTLIGGWGSGFFAALGPYTMNDGEGSTPCWNCGGYLITGGTPRLSTGYTFSFSAPWTANNFADLIQNCKLMIHWSTDGAVKSYNYNNVSHYLDMLKAAGCKQIVIDHWQNDTAALWADKFISIIPGTDEAMMAAIAYIWITQNLANTTFLNTYTVGYSTFHDYIMGVSDGVPKTPKWAEAICGVEAETINALALQWAANPTFIYCKNAGANRRQFGAEWVRMIVTLQAMSGNIGKPGCGFGAPGTPSPVGMVAPSVAPVTPHPSGTFPPRVQHVQFGQAMLNPPITWTAGDMQFKYPDTGNSEIHMVYFIGGTGYFLNQIGNVNDHIAAIQSPKIEFIVSQNPWWHALPYYSDIVLPVTTVGERDDIISWLNYSIYTHQLVQPVGQAMNDLDVFRQLGSLLGMTGFSPMTTTDDQFLQQYFAKSNIPMTYSQFKSKGWYSWTLPDLDNPLVGMSSFVANPKTNPLPTPSGLIEIASSRIANFYGSNDPLAPVVPKYIQAPESLSSSTTKQYPLFFDCGPHPRRGRHSQWNDVSWQRDIDYDYINGYRSLWMNPIDATARNLKYGDIVRAYNDRGQTLFAAKISQRVRPGIIWVSEGGHYTPRQPGVAGSLDLGGLGNVLLPAIQEEKIAHGQVTHTLVQVEKWSGS